MMPEKLWFLLLFPGLPTIGCLLWLRWWVARRNKKSRRPFRDMPRPAGWSLQQRTEELANDLLFYLMVISFIGIMAWMLYAMTNSFATAALFGLFASVWPLLQLRKTAHRLANHRLGLLGEQIVGGILDRLSSDTVQVFHDLEIKEPGKKPWNIDHVVLTPAGVFAFETKARRKPKDVPEGHKVFFHGDHLTSSLSKKPQRRDLEQVTGNARWLSKKLSAYNATEIPVQPVLVIPGWFVERKAKGEVSVLNEKQIPGFLNSRSAVLPAQLQQALASQLGGMAKVEFES